MKGLLDHVHCRIAFTETGMGVVKGGQRDQSGPAPLLCYLDGHATVTISNSVTDVPVHTEPRKTEVTLPVPCMHFYGQAAQGQAPAGFNFFSL